MGGDVTVTLTLTDGKITGCTAEGKDETPGIGTMALEQLPGAIAESGSIAVDGVATATIASGAIKEAAAAALTAAGLNADDYKTAVEAENTKGVERVSCTAVPVPTVRRVTFTPWASYNCRKASAVRRSVMVLIRNSELTALALLTVQ